MIQPSWTDSAEVVVIGAGVAGLAAALQAYRSGKKVLVLSKVGQTATHFAQGGIAVVLPDGADSIEAHVQDTVTAGAGLCDTDVVRSIVSDGYRAVHDLVLCGARFDETPSGRWSLTREGGHRTRRIIHAGGDATGVEVQRTLSRAAERLDVRSNHVVRQILTNAGSVAGVLVRNADGLGVIRAGAVILATGGLGHLYSSTTNPAASTADGVALALRAGVPVADIEFIQFHPTMLYQPGRLGQRPLISEAVRGEGAILVDRHGDSVTTDVHPLGDLAPRDVVAGAIARRLYDTGDECVYLDARQVGDFGSRFPTIATECARLGIDAHREPIPVVPGAHYSCGGVRTDAWGRTALAGLFAVGEVARTGMHGANRLASNSLLEGLVVGRRAGALAAEVDQHPPLVDAEPTASPAMARVELQAAMTASASVLRHARGLQALAGELASAVPVIAITAREEEDAAMTLTAQAVVAAALARTESRGCHSRTDCPESDPALATSLSVSLQDQRCHVGVPVPC